MRILHLYKTYYTESVGGVEQFIRQLGTNHARAGHDVSVLTLSRHATPREIWRDGVRVLRFPITAEIASNAFSLSACAHVRALAAQADVLHYHFPWPSGDVLHQLVPPTTPALVTYHSDIIRQRLLKHVYAPLMRRFLGQMQRIVATTPNYIATSPVLPDYAGKTTAVPIGLDEAMYPVPAAETLDHWRAKAGDGFFLFVGVLRYYKGLHTLVEAAARTGLPVVIAGDGPEEAALKAQAARLHAANIRFVGRVDDEAKMALLQLCRAFVFPSHQRSEAFGISLLEAAMVGRAMISCEIGSGMSYINQHARTGLVIPPEDAGALAQAMRSLAQDDAQCAAYGAAARQHFLEIFTAERMANSYLKLYETIIAEKQAELTHAKD